MGRTTILNKITQFILTGGRRTSAVNTRDVLNEMANTYVSSLFDTAANFTAANPILETKQIGIESDALATLPKFKLGDGVTAWNSLPYAGSQTLAQTLANGNILNAGQKILIPKDTSFISLNGTTDTIGTRGVTDATHGDGVKIYTTRGEISIYDDGYMYILGTVSEISANVYLLGTATLGMNAATPNEIAYFDASKNLKTLPVATYPSLLELSYAKGALSNLQNQINNINAGNNWKVSARGATTANVVLSGLQTIDSVLQVAGERWLVPYQTAGAENGIYIVSAGAWTRALDADTGAELLQATISIQEGTVNADLIFTCTTNAPITLGTTALVFAKTSSSSYTASDGVVLTGNNFTLNNAYFTGDATVLAGVVTIGAAKVTNAMLAGAIDLTTKVTGILPSANGGTGVNNAFNLTLASALSTTGAFATTFAQQAIVTITLPPVNTTLVGKVGTAVSGQIPFYSDANQQTTSANLTYDGTTQTITKNQNAQSLILQLTNTTVGAAASTRMGMSSDSASLSFFALSSAYTTAGMFEQGKSVFLSTVGNGVNIGTFQNAPLGFWTNNTLRAQFLSTGTLVFQAGTSTANTASVQLINGTRETTARGGLYEYENNHYKTNNSLVRYGLGGSIKDFITDVASTAVTTEQTIYTYNTLANTLAVNGDKIDAEYGLQLTSTGGVTKQLKVYFGGTVIFDSGALSISASTDFCLNVLVMRDSATTVRCVVTANTTGAATNAFAKVTKVTGLTLSGPNGLSVTAIVGAGAVAGDVTGVLGMIEIKASA